MRRYLEDCSTGTLVSVAVFAIKKVSVAAFTVSKMRIKNSQGFNLLHICETPLPYIVAFAVAAAAVAKITVVEFAVAVVSVAAVAITPRRQEQKSPSTVRVPANYLNYLI